MQRNQWFYRLLGGLLLAMTIFSQANTARAEAVVYDPGTGGITFSVDDTSVCGQVTLVFYNPTNTYAAPEYKVDDQEPTGSHPVVPDDGFYTVVNLDGRPTGANVHEATRVLTFEEDSGSHTYAIRLKLGGERDWDYDWQELTFDNTDCEPPPPGDTICEDSLVHVTPSMLNAWEISNDYNGTFNSEFSFTVDGLKIVNDENVARTRAMKVANKPLSEIDSLDLDRTGNATYQIEATGWEDGATFATLVWEEVYNTSTGVFDGYWWRSGSALGVPNGVNSATPYASRHQVDLGHILEANPNLIVLRYGVGLGSYQIGTSVITSIEFDCETTTFGPDEVEPEAPTFNEPTCHVPTASVGFPNNDFEYVVTGETVPGGSVHVMANLKPEVMNTIAVGTTEWDYTFVTVESLNCLIEVAAEGASITVIDQCGIYGSVTPSVTEGITYEVIPENPKEGLAIIEATANEGYVIVGQNRWVYYLGDYEDCVEPLTEVTPVEPEVTTITTCGMYGSVILPTTEGVTYAMDSENATEGLVMVYATSNDGYKLVDYTGPWAYYLGLYQECEEELTEVTPVEPTVTVIEACGQEGSVVLAETEGVTYTMVPAGATQGLVTVYAAAAEGYTLVNYTGPWAYYLGMTEECPPAPPSELEAEAPTYVEATCAVPTPQVVLPESDEIYYQVVGTTAAGGAVQVEAGLQDDAENIVLVGQTTWFHEFADLPDCSEPLIEVMPEEATVTPIEACETTGSIELPTTEGITYKAIPENATQGFVIVLAEANQGYMLVGYDGPAVYDLGSYSNCEVTPVEIQTVDPTFINPTCESFSVGLELPEVDGVKYSTAGDVALGKSIFIVASLDGSVENSVLVGSQFWFHEYPSAGELNCGTRMLFPFIGEGAMQN